MFYYIALTLGTPRPLFIAPETENAYLAARDGAPDAVLTAIHKNMYAVAAKVYAKDLGDLFYLTNTVDRPWMDNNGVTATGLVGRSMSVGDIAVNMETDEAFICAPVGWTKMEDETLALIFTTKALIADANLTLENQAA